MKRGDGPTAMQKNDKGSVMDIKMASKGSWEDVACAGISNSSKNADHVIA